LAFTSTSLRSRRSVLNLLQKYAAETFKKPFLLRKKSLGKKPFFLKKESLGKERSLFSLRKKALGNLLRKAFSLKKKSLGKRNGKRNF